MHLYEFSVGKVAGKIRHIPTCIDLCYVCKCIYVCTAFTELDICAVMSADDPIGMDSMV